MFLYIDAKKFTIQQTSDNEAFSIPMSWLELKYPSHITTLPKNFDVLKNLKVLIRAQHPSENPCYNKSLELLIDDDFDLISAYMVCDGSKAKEHFTKSENLFYSACGSEKELKNMKNQIEIRGISFYGSKVFQETIKERIQSNNVRHIVPGYGSGNPLEDHQPPRDSLIEFNGFFDKTTPLSILVEQTVHENHYFFEDFQNSLIAKIKERFNSLIFNPTPAEVTDFSQIEDFVLSTFKYLQCLSQEQYGHGEFIVSEILTLADGYVTISVPFFVKEPTDESVDILPEDYLLEYCNFGKESERETPRESSITKDPDFTVPQDAPNTAQDDNKVVVQLPYGNIQLVAQSLSGEALANFVKHLYQ